MQNILLCSSVINNVFSIVINIQNTTIFEPVILTEFLHYKHRSVICACSIILLAQIILVLYTSFYYTIVQPRNPYPYLKLNSFLIIVFRSYVVSFVCHTFFLSFNCFWSFSPNSFSVVFGVVSLVFLFSPIFFCCFRCFCLSFNCFRSLPTCFRLFSVFLHTDSKITSPLRQTIISHFS